MPLLIRTPEQIFREEEKDIYFIRFFDINEDHKHHQKNGTKSSANDDIRQWMKVHLPQVRIERMAPSEESGWVEGYFGDIRIDFSSKDLDISCAHWENEDGKSKDPRLQCMVMYYQSWLAQNEMQTPTREHPVKLSNTIWWNTPIGFIYSQCETNVLAINPRNMWMKVKKIWPELAPLDPFYLTHGYIFELLEGGWIANFSDHPLAKFSPSRQSALREWFHLPEEIEIYRDDWDC